VKPYSPKTSLWRQSSSSAMPTGQRIAGNPGQNWRGQSHRSGLTDS
jgi:hypothetical protein